MTGAVQAAGATPEEVERWVVGGMKDIDPEVGLLRLPLTSPGYHTTLREGPVHPLRESLAYAVGALLAGEGPWVPPALRMLDEVLRHQDADPGSPTRGVWPWYVEEPLSRMRPPDHNWADFCGLALVQLLRSPPGVLGEERDRRIRTAITLAAEASRRRNVSLDYTNIAVMGIALTLAGGALLGREDLETYGRDRLAALDQMLARTDGFSEYNSPTYTLVVLRLAARLRTWVSDERDRARAETLYLRVWRGIAEHFHVATGQWAGPHSRAYSTCLRAGEAAFLRRHGAGDTGITAIGDLDLPPEWGIPLACPDAWSGWFTRPGEPRTVIERVGAGSHPILTQTYLDPSFALGSVSAGDCWEQRRMLVGYWNGASGVCWLRLRLLADGRDLALGQVRISQKEGRALAGVGWATDGGLTHLHFDRVEQGMMTASDLRLRWEIGGLPAAAVVERTRDGWTRLKVGAGPDVWLCLEKAGFAELAPRRESAREDQVLTEDLVLHTGPARRMEIRRELQGAMAAAVVFGSRSAPRDAVRLERGSSGWTIESLDLRVALPPVPLPLAEWASWSRTPLPGPEAAAPGRISPPPDA